MKNHNRSTFVVIDVTFLSVNLTDQSFSRGIKNDRVTFDTCFGDFRRCFWFFHTSIKIKKVSYSVGWRLIIKNAIKPSTVIVKWQKTRFLGCQKELVLKPRKNLFFAILRWQSAALLHFLLSAVSRPNKKHFLFWYLCQKIKNNAGKRQNVFQKQLFSKP